MGDLTTLQTIWLVAIVGLWALYLVLEGFDFGVGMLLRRVRRDQLDRRVALHAIGPTWAANEVWAIVAVVGMFGAFPGWYAAWASGLYLPLLGALLAIVARNAAIELLGKREDELWRRRWERVLVLASTVAPFCWGVIWSAAVHGLTLRGEEVAGSPLDAFSAYSVLGGVTLVALCRAQGAAFLMLRTGEGVRERAARELRVAAPAAAVLAVLFLAWTASLAGAPGAVAWVALGGCAVAVCLLAVVGASRHAAPGGARGGGTATGRAGDAPGGPPAHTSAHGGNAGDAPGGTPAHAPAHGGNEWERSGGGGAFLAASAAIVLLLASWFCVLFPDAIAGAGDGAGLALADVAAGDYTLTLMTVVAGAFVPLLLAAQAATYWVFRHRVTRADVGEPPPGPVELVARLVGGEPDAAAPRGPGFRSRRGSS